MGRRAGGLVLGVALLAAAVVPNVPTRTVAGSASAVPVPGPPSVGDCLLQAVEPDIENVNGVLTLPAATIGSCTGRHYGEVIEMKSNFPEIPWVEGDPAPGMNDPHILDLLNCNSGSAYLGATPITSATGDVAGWVPDLMFRSGLVQPSARQQASGQRWAACVVLAAGIGTESGLALPDVARANQLRGAIESGSVPADFGLCSNPPVELQRPAPCTEPHTLQLLGTTDLATFATPAARLAACRTLAVSLTRMPDPSADGRLRLTAFEQRTGADNRPIPDGAPEQPGQSGTVTCIVSTVGTARLTDSLLGLGDRPVPLTA